MPCPYERRTVLANRFPTIVRSIKSAVAKRINDLRAKKLVSEGARRWRRGRDVHQCPICDEAATCTASSAWQTACPYTKTPLRSEWGVERNERMSSPVRGERP